MDKPGLEPGSPPELCEVLYPLSYPPVRSHFLGHYFLMCPFQLRFSSGRSTVNPCSVSGLPPANRKAGINVNRERHMHNKGWQKSLEAATEGARKAAGEAWRPRGRRMSAAGLRDGAEER